MRFISQVIANIKSEIAIIKNKSPGYFRHLFISEKKRIVNIENIMQREQQVSETKSIEFLYII